jgi:putative DNA primase/helicase
VAAEGAFGLKHRFRAYREYHQLGADAPAPYVISAAPNLSDRNDVIALAEELVRVGARVAVLDTLHASMMGLDENSAKDMSIVLGHARMLSEAIEGLVIIIHHTGKDASRGGRGSTSIPGAMETELSITNDDGLRTVRFAKQRDGRDDFTWSFRLVPVEIPTPEGVISSAVVTHCAGAKRRSPVAPIDRTPSGLQVMVLDVLNSMAPVYGDGVMMETLIQNIIIQRPDLRADSVKRSLTRMIDGGILSIDSGSNVRALADRSGKEKSDE